MSSHQRYDAFVITAPGLEVLAGDELKALGAARVRVAEGGVSFTASPRSLYEANLHLRTASRIVVRAAEFTAKAFHELERRAGKVPWETFLSPNLDVSVRVTCRKSRLYHSDAVAERVASAITSRVSTAPLGSESGVRVSTLTPDSDPDSEVGNQLIIVRIFHDRCTISVDSSGALLHLRGYRQAVGKAPIRETLAAAALMASGWKATTPLVDPMCGSGTLPIEGALIARRMAPGLRRRFAFQSWPDFHVTTWHDVEAEAEAAVLTRSPVRIQGSDRDAGAIEAARANAERAGVTDDIEFSERPISAITPPDEAGWVVSNPPYGVRVGEHDRLRNLYAQLGNVLRARCAGWQIALVSADPALERQLRIPVETILRTSNGGIKVRIVAGAVPMSRVRRPKSETPPDTAAAQRYPS